MPLALGTCLGTYQITAPIGAGGMGEVYRTRDTRLGRDVALKVLPEEFARDAERMARLRREAQVLASLNHPSIAAIYGFEDSSNVHALVMELVEGPTLAECIKAGAIPVDEALPLAKQICEAVEYAHERGIIHRDLKPANIKISRNDAVKILDFGLAKALEGDPASVDISSSPTISRMATQAGIILGTAAYMSPEQAKGKPVDRRADIWAFGCVLYEMLTGRKPFDGETVTDTLAAVIKSEPDWSQLPANTPQAIRSLLLRCLKKDPRQRLQSIGDARIAIDETLSGALDTGAIAAQPDTRTKIRERITWAGMALFAIAAMLFAVGYFLRAPQSAPAIVSQIEPPASTNFALAGRSAGPPAISPNGRRLAFSAIASDGKQRLWVRPLDSATAQPLEGTDGATFPFWSPDGHYLGFFANGKLNRIDASGGPPLAIADAPNGRGGAWNGNGTILFAPNVNTPVYRISASGGTPQPVTKTSAGAGGIGDRWPQFLPDGKHFLFYAHGNVPQNDATYAASLDGSEPKLLAPGDSNAAYAPPGYLLFIRQGTLMAQRFDAGSLRLSGEAIPLAERAEVNGIVWRGIFTVSENGILAYEAGGATFGATRILWYDRNGKQAAETGTPGIFDTPTISSDGDKLAITMLNPSAGQNDIWVYDLARGIPTRLTFSHGSVNQEPVWSPDGKTIAFSSNRSGEYHLYEKAADGTGSTTPLVVDDAVETIASWSADGRYLIFDHFASQPGSHSEIWAMPLFGERKAFPVVQDKQFYAGEGVLSPDGKWLAYTSNESGQLEIYIVPFLHGSGKREVSTAGGSYPRWRRDGRELFYLSPDNKIMSAEIAEQGASLTIDKVQTLFQVNPAGGLGGWEYDVSADGKKFVVVSQGAQQASAPLTLVTNWPALLKKQ